MTDPIKVQCPTEGCSSHNRPETSGTPPKSGLPRYRCKACRKSYAPEYIASIYEQLGVEVKPGMPTLAEFFVKKDGTSLVMVPRDVKPAPKAEIIPVLSPGEILQKINTDEFDYSGLEAGLAQEAQETAFKLRTLENGVTYLKGELLLQMKEKLAHGYFEKWVAEACSFSKNTAERYMAEARLIRENPQLEAFPAPIRRFLSQKSTPATYIDVASALIERGEISTTLTDFKNSVPNSEEIEEPKSADAEDEPAPSPEQPTANEQDKPAATEQAEQPISKKSSQEKELDFASMEKLIKRAQKALVDLDDIFITEIKGDISELVKGLEAIVSKVGEIADNTANLKKKI